MHVFMFTDCFIVFLPEGQFFFPHPSLVLSAASTPDLFLQLQ